MVTIKRFNSFLLLESSEEYLDRKLDEIELKIKKMFPDSNDEVRKYDTGTDEEDEEKIGKEIEEKPQISKDLVCTGIERSKAAKTYKDLKVFFQDDEFRYDLIISIPLEKAVVPKGQTFNPDDLKTCDIQFKRYFDGEEPLGVVDKKEVEIEKIDFDLLEELIVEIEEKYPSGEGEEEFSIETED
jgi:hypothetical protein